MNLQKWSNRQALSSLAWTQLVPETLYSFCPSASCHTFSDTSYSAKFWHGPCSSLLCKIRGPSQWAVTEWVSSWMSKWANNSGSEWVSEWITKQFSKWMSEWVNDHTIQHVNMSVSESATSWASGKVSEWVILNWARESTWECLSMWEQIWVTITVREGMQVNEWISNEVSRHHFW